MSQPVVAAPLRSRSTRRPSTSPASSPRSPHFPPSDVYGHPSFATTRTGPGASAGPSPVGSPRRSISRSREGSASRASSALAAAGLDLLVPAVDSRLSAPGASSPTVERTSLEVGLGQPRSRQVSFGSGSKTKPRPQTAHNASPTVSLVLSGGPFAGADASGEQQQQPQRKTSGPRAFLRRAKSFGQMSLVQATASANGYANGASAGSSNSAQLPPSPPLPSPPLSKPPPSPSNPHPSTKGKERASQESQPWAFSPSLTSSPTLGQTQPEVRLPPADVGRRSTSALLKRRSFSLWSRRADPPVPLSAPGSEPHLDAYAPPRSFDSARDHLLAPPVPVDQDAPSLPLFQLSASPYRMSWGFSTPPSPSPAPSVVPSPQLSPRNPRRPHSSSGPPGGGAWGAGPARTGSFVSSPAAVAVDEREVGLGFEMASNGSIKRRSTLTRLTRSNSDSARPPPFRPPSPLKPPSAAFVASPATSPSHERPPSLPRPRRPTTAGSASSVLSVVGGFFNSTSSSNMSRSSSAHSTPGGPTLEVGEFGALFDSKRSPRKRGLSVGNALFGGSASSSPNRKRAGSSSSLSTAWIPPGLHVPDAMPALPSASATSSRGSTDAARRFSFSSQASASSQSSQLLPPPRRDAAGMTPPASPTLTRRSSFAPRARAASVKVGEGETPEAYVERLGNEVRKSEVARLLASHADAFHTAALARYFTSFDFACQPLDIALRRFLMIAALPTETQQIDRVMEAFAVRYARANPGLFASTDTPYVLAFSLVMLSTDQFNPSNKNKMSKADYVRNTKVDGVSAEVLEYFFDQITITPFVFVEDDADAMPTRPELGSSTSSSFFGKASTAQKERAKLDPYHLIAQGQTHELRVDVESAIPEKSPFSFTGTTSFFNATTLHLAFARAPILQVTSRTRAKSNAGDLAGAGAPLAPVTSISTFAPPAERAGGVSSLKITKIGLLSRKEDLVEGGKKASSRKWKGWSVILTGSQLLFFKDPGVALSLQQAIEAAAMAVEPAPDENSVLVFSTTMGFKPDAVLSLANSAAIYDSTYSKYQHVFRLVAPAGRQYLFQARDADDLNAWLAHINYAASFKTAGVRMRSTAKHTSSPVPPSHATPPTWTTPTVPHASAPPAPLPVDLTLHHVLSPVTEEDPSLPPSLREALRSASSDRTPVGLGRPSSDFPFPSATSADVSPAHSTGASSFSPDTRAEVLRSKIAELEAEIKVVKGELHADLRLSRNLAVLTPFMRSTRERIQTSIVPIEKRVRHTRMALAKLVCHREVLTRDLLVEDRESQRTRKVSRGRLSLPPAQQQPASWPTGQRIGSQPFADDVDGNRDSFDSTADPYAGALTDDELDRMRAQAPTMLRSRTEQDGGGLLRAGSAGASEDELPSRDIAKQSPPESHLSLVPGHVGLRTRTAPSESSFADLTPSEVGSQHESLAPSPVEQPLHPERVEEEAEDWRRTRGAVRVSLIDYDSLALATLREERRGEGSAGSGAM